ncbi:unnamed protein product [Pseudo-nitzschia multistriata]|uniref:Uncharacterized protein n=1 Tax=Pseudo-nitzschia multistriata TaxID=183589 RepID=A0A448YXT1_9STRA|nr:unnamed protein product [Pseudo-nitzschia multistriata]
MHPAATNFVLCPFLEKSIEITGASQSIRDELSTTCWLVSFPNALFQSVKEIFLSAPPVASTDSSLEMEQQSTFETPWQFSRRTDLFLAYPPSPDLTK